MLSDFVELFRTSAASRSLGARVKCWGIVLRDLLVSVPRERFASKPKLPQSSPSPRSRESHMASMLQDLRYAVRMLRQHPGFSFMVIVTLALGIGANITMFSVIDGVLFSSLPYDEPERLVTVWNRHAATGSDRVQISGLDFLDYRERATTFEDFAAIHNSINQSLTDDGPAEQIVLGIVSSNFLQFLGREPMLGRPFTPDDEVLTSGGGPGPAVISYGLWSRRYGADPNVLGKTIYLGGVPMEVIGVMPEDFELVMPEEDGGEARSATSDPVDVWRFLPERAFRGNRSLAMFRILGRMQPGITFQQAQQQMDLVARQLRTEHQIHDDRGMQIDLVPMHADVVKNAKPVVLALFGAVGFVLLIACANVANLILARGARRQREFVLRAALGADRTRLVRQVLTETTVLAVVGTALGLVLATVGIDTIVALAPSNVPMIEQVGINANVLLFAVGITAVAVVLFGLIPAMRVSRTDFRTQLSDGALAVGGRFHRMRSAIVVAEIGVSLVLLVGGGLMIRSFQQLQGARLGFEPTFALTLRVALPHGPYDDEAVRTSYWNALRREAAQVPTVAAAGLVWPLPFGGNGSAMPYSAHSGSQANQGRYMTTVSEATPGFFEAMDARLLDGRTFTEADIMRDAEIVIVDDIVAERLFPGERAVGRTFWLQDGDEQTPLEIVGVVEHIRHQTILGPERETVFRPTAGGQWMALVLRAERDPYGLLPELRQIGASLDPGIPLFNFRTFDEYLGVHIAPTRFTMTLASVFAVVALVLSSVGLYGVISYSVAQRASEIGVRMALGAHDTTILRLVLGNGAVMVASGIGLGLVASLALTRAIRSLLYGVTPTDPVTFVGVSLLLAAVALVATYVPARRAARVDPMAVLRRE
jgi:predicted permease